MSISQAGHKIKDHSVTGEEFELQPFENGALLKTIPQPEPGSLGRYYQSENYISHTDGARNLFEKAYQFIKKIALRDKVQLINSVVPAKGSLLDIGCGTGDFLVSANKAGWEASGSEPSESARNIAISKNSRVAADTSSFPEAQFDVITMWHVLEHVPDPDRQIQEVLRLLKNDGIVIIAVPNFRSADANHYGKYWAAYDVPRHLWHFSRDAMANLAGRNGMKIFKRKPMWFDAFYVSLLSEKNKTGRIRPVAGLWNGLRSNLAAITTGECSSVIYLLRRE